MYTQETKSNQSQEFSCQETQGVKSAKSTKSTKTSARAATAGTVNTHTAKRKAAKKAGPKTNGLEDDDDFSL